MTQFADAFVSRFEPPLGAETSLIDGALLGLTIAVKDNFDIAGYVTGGGNPEWAATHGPATRNATVVQQLLDQGAQILGKAQMDELAYSLMGQNARYGTPQNPFSPDRMPGGSSSGSASAVAAGDCDIGLGTDTGGSVRIPSAFCGLFGWRPTHGLLPSMGLLPLAQSYDVPGFITRNIEMMERLAVLFAPEHSEPSNQLTAPEDLWSLASPEVQQAAFPYLSSATTQAHEAIFTDEMRATLLPTFQVCQGAEIATNFADWISETKPEFGPGIRERFAAAIALTNHDIQTARTQREVITAHLVSTIHEKGVIALPTAPGPAPLLSCSGAEMNTYRNHALTLLCLSGHAGLPQISIPLRLKNGLSVGLSLIGPRNSDRALIRRAAQLCLGS